MQDQFRLDPQTVNAPLSIGAKLYILLLFASCVAAIIKLFRIWRVALPFKFSRKQISAAYLRQLQASALSIRQWMGFTLITWAVLASFRLTEICRYVLYARAVPHTDVIMSDLVENATYLSMALLVVAFLYIIRWHLLTRGECIRTWGIEENIGDSAL